VIVEPFIGEIRIFAGNFAPRNWATCDGQLMAIQQNTALFSLLGTVYGGNGTTTFALPDLRGRAPMQYGQGPGLSPRDIGESGGVESVTLTQAQMPAHNHSLNAAVDPGDQKAPGTDRSLARSTGGAAYGAGSTDKEVTLNASALSPAGEQGLPHNNLQPYLPLTFIIALYGVYPARP
jgi:microcystin-dependent protein